MPDKTSLDPQLIVSATLAALQLVEQLLPALQHLGTNGQITAEQQQNIRDRYAALHAAGDTAFGGPEWQSSS